VEILDLVHDMLPLIATLVTRDGTAATAADKSPRSDATDSSHRYYAIVESDHPYKPAAVHNYRVTTTTLPLTYNINQQLLVFDISSTLDVVSCNRTTRNSVTSFIRLTPITRLNYSNTTKIHTVYRRFGFTSEAFITTDVRCQSSICKSLF